MLTIEYEENYFDEYSEEELLKINVDDKKQFPDEFFSDGRKIKLSEEEVKEERLKLKREYYRKLWQLGLIEYTSELREELGYGHYRKDKGYNKYHEWRCSKCKQYKPRTVEYFPKDKKRRNGLGYICRECLKEYSKQRYYSKKQNAKSEKSQNEE